MAPRRRERDYEDLPCGGHIPRWSYTYEDDELYELVSLLPKDRLAYVFFNNITMKDDAVRFERVLDEAVG